MPEERIVVMVDRVTIPAMSTVGYGFGTTESGEPIQFVGDHRPMRELGIALREAQVPVVVSVEPWQIVSAKHVH